MLRFELKMEADAAPERSARYDIGGDEIRHIDTILNRHAVSTTDRIRLAREAGAEAMFPPEIEVAVDSRAVSRHLNSRIKEHIHGSNPARALEVIRRSSRLQDMAGHSGFGCRDDDRMV
jgi:hypothetical protein